MFNGLSFAFEHKHIDIIMISSQSIKKKGKIVANMFYFIGLPRFVKSGPKAVRRYLAIRIANERSGSLGPLGPLFWVMSAQKAVRRYVRSGFFCLLRTTALSIM